MPHREPIVSRLEKEYAAAWNSLKFIQKKFAAKGFSLFLVGGAVRNLVLGTGLKDFDLASDALPQDVQALFPHVIPTGIQHGTVTLVHRGEHFEITTFRLDGSYSDARRPDSVAFTPDILEDLTRRDFTINAMALDLSDLSLLDPHNGRSDLAAGIIRTVGAPLERFGEDGLRIVRGIRFAAQLGFHIESDTYAAMKLCLDKLAKVSIERFRDELFKTLDSNQPSRGLFLMRETGIFPLFLPTVAGMDRMAFALAALTADLLPVNPTELRFAAILMYLEPSAAMAVCAQLKLSNNACALCGHLVSLLEYSPDAEMSPVKMRRFAAKAGRNPAATAADFLIARAVAQGWLGWNPDTDLALTPTAHRGQDGDLHMATELTPAWSTALDSLRTNPDFRLSQFKNRLQTLLSENPPLAIRDLAINGQQLQAAGIPAGPAMGRLLQFLLDQVIEQPEHNSADWLLAEARKFQETSP